MVCLVHLTQMLELPRSIRTIYSKRTPYRGAEKSSQCWILRIQRITKNFGVSGIDKWLFCNYLWLLKIIKICKFKVDMANTETLQMSAGIQMQITANKYIWKNLVPFVNSDFLLYDQVMILLHVILTTSPNKLSLSLIKCSPLIALS